MDDLKALADQLRSELSHDKGWDYTEYEKGRIAEKERTIALLEAALSRPAGGEWVMVPREPTPEMLAAPQTHDSPLDDGTRRIWSAMLAAAPTPHGGEDAWQPIETAPDGIEALVTGYNYGEPSKGRYYSAAKLDGGAWYGTAADDGDDELGWLTHWRPLTNPDTAIAASREVG